MTKLLVMTEVLVMGIGIRRTNLLVMVAGILPTVRMVSKEVVVTHLEMKSVLETMSWPVMTEIPPKLKTTGKVTQLEKMSRLVTKSDPAATMFWTAKIHWTKLLVMMTVIHPKMKMAGEVNHLVRMYQHETMSRH